MSIRFSIGIAFFCFISNIVQANDFFKQSSIYFEENKGQWPSTVLFKSDLNSGRVFFENNKFTYVYFEATDLVHAHELFDKENDEKEIISDHINIQCHSFQVKFLDSKNLVKVHGNHKKNEYLNYFIGADRSKWASNVGIFNGVYYSELYPSIDLHIYEKKGNLKYDFILSPDADIKNIKLEYDGVNEISLSDGNLLLTTSVNEIVEQKPYAYQEINGQKIEINCRYILNDNEVSFELISPYNPSLPLVIDPIIIASTYSGSSMTAWGSCSSYDTQGNIYTGGVSWGPGYPVTVGAYNTSFSGNVDIAITKLNSNGSARIYSTYIGSENYEYPQSILVNSNAEVYLLSQAWSDGFPTTNGCFDSTYNGGKCDIVLSHLNNSCSSFIGSSYIGGNSTDCSTYGAGSNVKPSGDMAIDSIGNIFVLNSSKSPDFPITAGAQAYIAELDLVIFKMNSACSNLLWSTYLGGSGDDFGYGIKIVNSVDLLITGSTSSIDFPTTLGAYQTSYIGGDKDGFVLKFNPTTNTLGLSTFYGTSATDQAFFIETNSNNEVFILGQTDGVIPITNDTYGNINSKNFIAKFNSNLSNLVFQTVIGNGISGTSIIPTAFMVDYCDNIYLSGYNSTNGSNTGYPISSNAFYISTSNAANFYFAELSKNAKSLLFGTFFPGLHCHSGISRFDKQGIIYQSICAGNGFPTLPNAISPANNCAGGANDICALKIDFQSLGVFANASVSPTNFGCKPFQANFSSDSSYGRIFRWNFNDGSAIDTLLNPTHVFNDTGNFNVQLFVIDSGSCYFADTFDLIVNVNSYPTVNLGADTIICPGKDANYILHALNPQSIKLWSTGDTTESISVSTGNIYWVKISNGTCSSIDTVNVKFVNSLISPHAPYIFCNQDEAWLNASMNSPSYTWSTGDTGRKIHVLLPGDYWYQITHDGCMETDTLTVSEIKQSALWIPSAFTPNGDGRNDEFNPLGNDISSYNMQIYTRWGDRLFSTDNLRIGWDGTFKGDMVQPGIYLYVIEYMSECDAYPIQRIGWVSLTP